MRAMWLALWITIGAAAVVRGDEAALEMLQRLQKVDRTDPAALLSLASWAEARGLQQPAAELYRGVLRLKPGDDTAYAALNKIADTTELPRDEKQEQEIQAEFPGKPLHVTSHFLIIYGKDRNWAMNRAVLLEKAHDVYYQVMRKAQLRPLPLDKRLVCVLFDDHDDYAAYAQRVDGATARWMAGYYSGKTNRIAFYNDKSNPAYEEVKQKVAALEQQLQKSDAALKESIRRQNMALVAEQRREVEGLRRQINWYRNRHAAVAGLADAAKTTHEAVHQLAYNSGVQRRGTRYPFWLSEGLACSFEPEEASRPFGPYVDNPGRRQRLREAAKAGRLMDLDKFMFMRELPADVDAVADLYAQAWGVMGFLFRKRQPQLRAYLEQLATGPAGERDDQAMRMEVEKAFGSMAELQTHWAVFLREMR